MKAETQTQSMITCPRCGLRHETEMPTDACLFFMNGPGAFHCTFHRALVHVP